MFFHDENSWDMDCDWEPQPCPLCNGVGCETCEWSGEANEEQLRDMRNRTPKD